MEWVRVTLRRGQAHPCLLGGAGGKGQRPCPEEPDSQRAQDSWVFSGCPSVFRGRGELKLLGQKAKQPQRVSLWAGILVSWSVSISVPQHL